MDGRRKITQKNIVSNPDPQQSPASKENTLKGFRREVPSISLPKGGGAIRSVGEKFAANPVTGTGSLSVPIATSPGRSGFGPQLSLTYDSGSGNGPFGFGWNLSLPSITRKTDKGLPKYQDGDESDTFILSGAEDLVPVLKKQGNDWVPEDVPDRTIGTNTYRIKRYRPRIEGLFARIERWTNIQSNETHWRSISRNNITTVYGRTTDSRIEDSNTPEGSPRVFSWLICESYDDKGNAIYYEYEKENSKQIDLSFIHERNRTDKSRSANRYLKRIKYGNKTPVEYDSDLPREFREDLSERTDWLFEVVFDYEEGHYEELPADPNGRQFVNAHKDPTQNWQRRQDPFSSYRSGFEVRTYRLCLRVLMFHHFADELGVDDYLVRTTEFKYKEGPIASFITSVKQFGYKLQDDGAYLKNCLPPLEFKYSEAVIQDKVEDVDEESIENLPQGLDGTQYQWVDIDGEGASGILTEQGNAWFYKRNVGVLPVVDKDGKPHSVARFAPAERLAKIPSFTNLSEGRQQLLDLAGDGQLDVVEFDSPTPGFYERTKDEAWHTFKPFVSLPNIPWQDPNLKFVDLTGDGHADIFITEDDAFTWYPSLAETGFASGEKVRQALDEEKGPKLVFADGTQSIYLADISGDGVTDLVRIRNGEVCYWPNLGYGHFGAKVTMDNSPHFDAPDQFDQRRIRLADIDGSGVTDIIYLKGDGVYIYLNESGNRWAEAEKLKSFPKVDNLSSVMAVDLLGNGTACLVWSSRLPGHARKPMRYIKLMGEQKPHLLVKTVNNLGAETHVQYVPSTKFYLADKLAGKPWITNIPFPVHVVERVETYDRVSRNRFVTRYAYHHGYFDGIEREFRGFGLVEQWDTEEFAALNTNDEFPQATNINEASHVPPVLTRTWFHTGAYLEGHPISRQFEDEYYRESDESAGVAGLTDSQLNAMLLDDTVLPDIIHLADGTSSPYTLSTEEAREAYRSLKGSMLRQEIFALDGSEEEDRPYIASEQNYTIEMLQVEGPNHHAVFFNHDRETINLNYERKLYDIDGQKLADPRVSHSMTLAVDNYGNVLQSVAIGYGRRFDESDAMITDADREKQKRTFITYTDNRYTNSVLEDDAYRTRLQSESLTYELLKVTPGSSEPNVTNLFRFNEMEGKIQAASAHDIPYEDIDATSATQNHPYRRLIEHLRQLYYDNDLSGPLLLGKMQSLGLPYETYKLAFTPQQLINIYKREGVNLLPNPAPVLRDEGGYVLSDDYKAGNWFPNEDLDGHWWIPSGQQIYSMIPENPSPPKPPVPLLQDTAYARAHFFLVQGVRDTFGSITRLTYDNFDLLLRKTEDPLGNVMTAGTKDDDGNNIVALDYRVLQPWAIVDPNENSAEVAFNVLGRVVGTAVKGKNGESDSLKDFKADLSQQEIDDFFNDPKGQISKDLLKDATTRLIYDVTRYHRLANPRKPIYTASLARETHVNAGSADGQLKIQVSFSYSDGFGREIQKKIQAEPGSLIDGGPTVDLRWVGSGWTIFNNKGKPVRQYEPFFSDIHDFKFASDIGVSPILFYDPVERVIATLHPNHTWEKVVFDPWRQETWDVNDTLNPMERFNPQVGDLPSHTFNPTNDSDVGHYFSRLSDDEYLPTWYDLRRDETKAAIKWPDADKRATEKSAADKAAKHAATPTVAHLDTLARTFLTVADNGMADNGDDQEFKTRIELDIEGNQCGIIDALNRIVTRYYYDMLSNRIHHASMEAGKRWMLNDVAGKPIRAWDSRGHNFKTEYDQLRRPLRQFDRNELFEKMEYGEGQANDIALNLRTRVFKQYDGAGVVTNDYDFKGNLLHSRRQLVRSYTNVPDWSVNPALEPEVFLNSIVYDALNRPIQLVAPHNEGEADLKTDIIQPRYNEANLLEGVDVWLKQAGEPDGLLNPQTANQHTVKNIDFNAKGQRTFIEYGNGVVTTYKYDPDTFRLVCLFTVRPEAGFPGDCPQVPPAGWTGCQVQSLHYTYDPVGNIIHIRDNAQQTIYFRNKRVKPSNEYTYDAIYRLIEAAGREHLGQAGEVPTPASYNDKPRVGRMHPSDGNAMGTYREQYLYDEVGNFLQMIHQGTDPIHPGWTRTYIYNEPSLLEPGIKSNRLTGTTVGATQETYSTNGDGYDPHGNMLKMPQLQVMQWDFKDQLCMTQRQAVNAQDVDGQQRQGERTYYVYDAAGQRVRKVTERANNQVKDERIYLGGFEIYHKHGVNAVVRETLHVMGKEQCIALVETRTQGNDNSPAQLSRYRFSNHLDSATLELDSQGRIISYEEYYPYGSTSYQAVSNLTEVSKRYRYTGKERDEESGLYYYGARYYGVWLARWVSSDPAGLTGGINVFLYCNANPIRLRDTYGLQAQESTQIGPLRLENINITPKPNLQLNIGSLQFNNLFADEPTSISGEISIVGGLRITSDVALSSINLSGRAKLDTDIAARISSSEGRASASISGEFTLSSNPFTFDLGPYRLDLGRLSAETRFSAQGATSIDMPFSPRHWQSHLMKSFENFQGKAKIASRLKLAGSTLARLGVTAQVTSNVQGAISISGDVGLGPTGFGSISGAGSFTRDRFEMSGTFEAGLLPLAYTRGRWSYSSSSGFNASGHILGPVSLTASINPTGVDWRNTGSTRQMSVIQGGNAPISIFEPGLASFGYSYFEKSPNASTYFAVGASATSSSTDYYENGMVNPSLPILGSSVGPYFGLLLSGTY